MIPARTLPPRALVIAVTPLLDERSIAALVDLQHVRSQRTAAHQDAVLDAASPKGKLLAYPTMSRTTRSSSASRNGLASQRQPLSSRKRAASVPVTSPVTKITRRA